MGWNDPQYIVDAITKNNAWSYKGRCNTSMPSSTTDVYVKALAGFGDAFFANHYYMQVTKNANSAAAAPDGEYRKVTAYTSVTGKFVVDPFSANVESTDEIVLIHEVIFSLLVSTANIDNFILTFFDDFSKADADADTEWWSIPNVTAAGYLVGTEGAGADINTTTAGKMMVKVDPDATPTEARVARYQNLPIIADYFTLSADLDTTFGAGDSATPKAAGIIISKGAANTYNGQNYVAIERQKGTGIDRIRAHAKFNNVAQTAVDFSTSDNAVAFKIERWDQVWKLYYSTVQYSLYDWIFLAQFEDPSNYMTNSMTAFLEVYSIGTLDAESVQADFDNFQYFIGSGGGAQFIAGVYDSSWVSSNADGNIFERLEDAKEGLFATTGAAYSTQINNAAATENFETTLKGFFTWVGIGGTSQLSKISNIIPATFDAAIQSISATIGIDGTNVFSSTVQGAARTTLEAVSDGLAAYFSESGAAWSVTLNNAAENKTLETTIEALNTWIGISGTSQLSKISNAVPTTLDAAIQAIAKPLAVDGANELSSIVNGTARTTLEGISTGLASYFTASGAQWSVQVNKGTTRNDFELTFEDFLGLVGCNGTDQFLPTIGGSTRATFEDAFAAIGTELAIIVADTEKIYDVTFGTSPAAGSLASYIVTGGTGLGTVLPASTSLYDTTKNIRNVAINGSCVPLANTLSDILHKDGSYTYSKTTDSLEALGEGVSAAAAYAIINSGIAFRADISSLSGCADKTEFICSTLIGVGDGAFMDATAPYRAFIFHTITRGAGGGVAPQGETQNVGTFVSSTGKFTLAAAVSASFLVGDTVIIMHPRIAELANITSDVQIRVASSGAKLIGTGVTKYLSLDSLTNGAEIISVIFQGVIGSAWTIAQYVPYVDAVAAPAAADKRMTITYDGTEIEAGLFMGFGIPFNAFFNITNGGVGDQTIYTTIVYRSRAALTVQFEA